MRIARVLTRLNLGGPSRQVLASDPLLMERGHELRIFVGTPEPGEGDLFETARERGLDVIRLPGLSRGLSPIGDRRAERALRKALLEFEPDLLHTHATKAGMVGRRAARNLASTSKIHTFHGHVFEGYFPEPIAKVLIRREQKLSELCDRIVAVSHATADDLVRLAVVPEEKLVVIPPGANLDHLLALERPRNQAHAELRREIGAGSDDFVVGMVGRLAPVKQPQMAIDVFEMMAARHPQLHMVFIGDGSERGALERRIGGLAPGLSERVHMLGAVDDMTPVFASLDAVMLTSHSEGLPVALIEAAAAGLPALSTNVGGVSEIVAHERTGFIAEDAAELAYGLDQMLGNPIEAAAMGQRARVRVSTRYSAKSLADRLEALYEAVRKEHSCAS
ncbi:MAG: glycosyltransferase involved in cell wall biosynthesis [Planctomycetota bacterium]|jgi:glycosyltransferase involved in cell wall biosynthesis